MPFDSHSSRRAQAQPVLRRNKAPAEELYRHPGALIRRMQQVSLAIFMEGFQGFRITPLQYTVLRIVNAQPGIDQITVASRAALDASTVKDILARLEAKGLVRRQIGTKDRRTKSVFLTKAGATALGSVKPQVRRMQKRLLLPLSKAEQNELLRLIAKLVSAHEEQPEDPNKQVPWKRFGRMRSDNGTAARR